MTKLPSYFMVFDVESIGLHGESFAVGWVVIDGGGSEYEAVRLSMPMEHAKGAESNRLWVRDNVPDFGELAATVPEVGRFTAASPQALRESFWKHWQRIKATWKGVMAAADCPWPVEARFLAACVDDEPAAREWEGPYPLIDVASVRLAADLDPLGTNERLPNELPQHDPLADARQSARLLVEALR